MSALKTLMHRLTQAQKAQAYQSFLIKYNTEEAAQEVLAALNANREIDVILERVVIAFTLDAMRKAAERKQCARTRKPRPILEK